MNMGHLVDGRPLFDGASAINPTGHKVGFVGGTGTGNTTPAKLRSGIINPAICD
jgi:ATP-binding cassette, subfamily F, member 3